MTEWEPATEVEAAMRDALRASDQELYFRILSRTDLLLPVSADALAGRAPMGWGTWTTAGRTHVLAFTSPAAVRACLAENAGPTRRVPFAELANEWPNLEWWLAVNPGLPVEGYLPAWFVAQLARGDVRLPGRTMGARARLERAEHVARARATAVVPGRGEPIPPPPPAPVPRQPGPPPEPPFVPPVVESAPPVVESAPPAPAAQPESAGAASAWLAAAYRKPGVAPESHGDQGDRPASNGFFDRYEAPAPVDPPADEPGAPLDPGHGQPPYLSVQPVSPAPGDFRPIVIEGTVIDPPADVPPPRDEPVGRLWAEPEEPLRDEPVRDDLPPVEPSRVDEMLVAASVAEAPAKLSGAIGATDFQPANDVEESLLTAAGDGSTDTFLSTLLLAWVLLPVSSDSAPGSLPGQEGFVWATEKLDGAPYVVVYTSPERLADQGCPAVETVRMKFAQLIRKWPDESWSFAVNPGTPVGAKLPGSQIVALANWAAEVGLGDDTVEPVEAPPPVEESAPRTPYAPAVTDPLRPTVMQKTIAPSQLAYYLDRGYDRISGFVHRANEVVHLNTPGKLHAALGLSHPGSPFSADDSEVYVLRWAAHRPSLYRIPYGGQSEAAMRAMEGWVIERPPFRGNGFAPGESTDVIAEFKVDSARLPHGAELWRIGADGTEQMVAVLDSDSSTWRRVDQ